MTAYRLKNGNLVVPFRVESKGVIGDAFGVISPSHPHYEGWSPHAENAPLEIESAFGKVEPMTKAPSGRRNA